MTQVEQDEPRVAERRVFGEYPQVQLPVGAYVRLPQVRGDVNPELANLKASIAEIGLLNAVDVAKMTPADLESYIEFVNRIWATNASIMDYGDQRQPDGSYYLVIAGHSRVEAIQQLSNEDKSLDYVVTAKVHEIKSVEQIIALQLGENIHSQPARERRAVFLVESYEYGLETGRWSNPTEFQRVADGRFSKRELSEALGFAKLPMEARDMVFAKQIPYAAGVELGVVSETIYDYLASKAGLKKGDAIPKEMAKDIDKAYRITLAIMTSRIRSKKLNGSASKKYIAGQINLMRKRLNEQSDEPDSEELFAMVSSAQQSKDFLGTLEAELRSVLQEIASGPFYLAASYISLADQLTGSPDPEVAEVLGAAAKGTLARLGTPAVQHELQLSSI